jgi:hypothetical protein
MFVVAAAPTFSAVHTNPLTPQSGGDHQLRVHPAATINTRT